MVCATIALVPITATGASVALPDISANLSTGLDAAQWVVNAFFLTFASFMAISGSLADLTGRRRMFTVGITLFCTAMLAATLAPNIGVLITARVIAGIGAAAATTGGSALLAHAFEGKSRIRAFGAFGTAIGLGLAFGPVLAGVLVTSLGGWRAFFLVAAAVLLPLLAASLLLPESKDAHPAGPDRASAVTFTAGLSLLVLSLVEGPTLGWGHPLVIGSLAASALLIAAFAVVERHVERPLVDVSLFAQPRFLAICLVPVLLAFGFVALLIVLPPYFMAVNGLSAQGAGLLLVLLTGPTLVVPALVSSVAHRISHRILLVATMLFVASGAAWLTGIHPQSTSIELAGPLITIGVGFGISLAILDGAAVNSVEPARSGMASGVFNTIRLGGESMSIAVLGAILAAATQDRLVDSFGPDSAGPVAVELLQGDIDGAAAAAPNGMNPDVVREAAATAYTGAVQLGMWTIAAVSLLGAVVVGILAKERTTPAGVESATERTAEPTKAGQPAH